MRLFLAAVSVAAAAHAAPAPSAAHGSAVPAAGPARLRPGSLVDGQARDPGHRLCHHRGARQSRPPGSATYDAVDRDVADATKAAAAKARAISGALSAFGADKVRVETRFNVAPLYEQYRDKNGQLVDNGRADKIDRYQVSIEFSVELRDMRLVEPVYAILMSAKPSQSGSPSFRLEVSDEVRTEMFRLAVDDARKRAEQAAAAAGTKIGAVRLIDSTARGCETDELLALAGRGYDQIAPRPVAAPRAAFKSRGEINELVVTAQRKANAAGLRPEDLQLPVQPPLEQLTGKACVVYSLG